VWFRGAAIRPVPLYARVEGATLEDIERELGTDTDEARTDLDAAFSRFERTQPALSEKVGEVLARPLDDTALALGYFLAISIWLAFERTFGMRLREVSDDALRATDQAVALEEELRASHGEEPLDLDDVVSIEQPSILSFVHEHVDAALDVTARAGTKDSVSVMSTSVAAGSTGAGAGAAAGALGKSGAATALGADVDVDDVHIVYKSILVMVLALSHAVMPLEGTVRGSEEMLA
jgi:hypothetical protein